MNYSNSGTASFNNWNYNQSTNNQWAVYTINTDGRAVWTINGVPTAYADCVYTFTFKDPDEHLIHLKNKNEFKI